MFSELSSFVVMLLKWIVALTTANGTNQPNSPSILGIWRLGKPIHQALSARLNLAQPADAASSPRWDYMIKFAFGADRNAENLNQIVQFAAACNCVSHPNLVPVLDASGSGAFPYLVMPRIEGETLDRRFRSLHETALPVVLWMVRQTAQALDAIHQAGWVHGDVKPENIIVGSRGHVTLIDLGSACQMHTLSPSKFRGTPEYAAPETLQGNMAALAASDVFSLGRVLWQSLTKASVDEDSALPPVAELIETMVAPQPTDRPSAGEVVNRLLQLEIDTLGNHFRPTAMRRAA